MLKSEKIRGGICTFERYEGRTDIGSSRIRGTWIANHWDNVELFVQGKEYDFVIYQKAYWVEHAKVFKGIKIFDLCDPDFLHWGYRTKQMIDNVDAVTTSTEALAEALRKFTDKPVVCIPDRVDFNFYNIKKKHFGTANMITWFGYSNNFEMLKPAVKYLIENNLDLVVVSDKDFIPQPNEIGRIEVFNYRWNYLTANENILKGDMLLNPQASKGKWKFKSNNKTLAGIALGLPVATNIDELKRFKDCDERVKEVKERTKELKEKWDVKISISELKALINEIIKNRKIKDVKE